MTSNMILQYSDHIRSKILCPGHAFTIFETVEEARFYVLEVHFFSNQCACTVLWLMEI